MDKPERIIVGQFDNPSPQFTMYTKPKPKKTLGQKIALGIIPFAIIIASIVSEVGYDLAEEEHTFTESERIDTIHGTDFHVYLVPDDFREIRLSLNSHDDCVFYDYEIGGEDEWERVTCEYGYQAASGQIYARYAGGIVEIAVSKEPNYIEYQTENQFVSDVTDTVLALLWLAIPGSVIAYFYLGRMNKQRHA